MYNYQLDGLNMEVTTKCPLHCPQCYCSLESGKDIPLHIATRIIEESAAEGLTHIEFSGGETLCYPHLIKLISIANQYGIETSISISGWGFNAAQLNKLIEAGIDTIYVSLNGPSEQDNRETRDGYDLAIHALEVLKQNHFPNIVINWVMHRNNADTLPNMIALGREYDVSAILIIEPKPSFKRNLLLYPTKNQLTQTAIIAKHHSGQPELWIHHCFSPLLALCSDNKLWGNSNRGIYKGCSAGLASISVNVEGKFIPCRHLPYPEDSESLHTYWKESVILNSIRSLVFQYRSGLCEACRFSRYCRPCLSHNEDIQHLKAEPKECPVREIAVDISPYADKHLRRIE